MNARRILILLAPFTVLQFAQACVKLTHSPPNRIVGPVSEDFISIMIFETTHLGRMPDELETVPIRCEAHNRVLCC
jgi:hypothetical protein